MSAVVNITDRGAHKLIRNDTQIPLYNFSGLQLKQHCVTTKDLEKQKEKNWDLRLGFSIGPSIFTVENIITA